MRSTISVSRRSFLALAASAALALGGCGGKSGEAAPDDGKRKVATVSDGPINDGGWNASCYKAMCDAAEKLGWDTAYSENVAQSDWATTFQNYIDEGYDLLFIQGEEYKDAVEQVSEENPSAHFALLQGDVESDGIESLAPDSSQIGQLAGALAGLLTKTGSVGFIGGVELDSTLEKIDAFQGALTKANPDATATVVYAGSFTDAAKGKEIASSMVNQQNVDVLFGDASIVDTGAREALAGMEGRYDIGQPGDIGAKDSALIACSVVTDNETMLEQSMRNVENGTFGNKTILGNLENGGVRVGTFSDTIVDAATQEAYGKIVERIKAGTYLD